MVLFFANRFYTGEKFIQIFLGSPVVLDTNQSSSLDKLTSAQYILVDRLITTERKPQIQLDQLCGKYNETLGSDILEIC